MIAALVHLARLARVGTVFAREGVLGLIDPRPLPWPARAALRCARLIERPTSSDSANRLSAALTALGPTYVKLGQFLATRPDVVGVGLARDLESLLDRMPPFPQAQAEAAVAAALDRPLKDGRVVAVKVLRPGVEHRFKTDLAAFFAVARMAEDWSADARRISQRYSSSSPTPTLTSFVA